ncbi:MAG: TonB-dependent receptor [Sphingobium sp.]
MTPAHAQEEAAEFVSDADIVVTARRREESLLDVPVAVSAFSGEKLETQGALDITDIANITPNTTLENSRGTNSTLTAFIRGVGQQDPVPGFEAGIGIYLDDVYLNRPQAAVLDIYDVERIEVLRGPQGTLYGRNTIGGAIKYVTKRLSDKPELRIRATYGTYDQADLVVTGSVPVSDMFRVGASVARLSRGGFGDNLTIAGLENYNKDVWAARGTVEMGGTGAPVLIRISGDYTRDKSDPRNGHRLIPGLYSGAPVLGDVYDTEAGLNNPKQDVKAYGLAMNITADLSDAITFRSISAWRKDTSYTPIDFDSLPSVDVDVPAVYRNEQISQEFQILYKGERLNGLLGFYYLDASAATEFDVLLGLTGELYDLPGYNAYTAGNVKTNTWSVFGDFTFDFTDQLSLSLGGRFTNDKRKAFVYKDTRITGTSPVFGGVNPPFITAVATNFNGQRTFKEFTPRASLSFKPNDDNMVYASYSKGFKGGGFDPRGSATQAPDVNQDGVRSYQEIYDFLSFDPEKVDTYELGYKGALFDRRLTLSIAGFYSDYKDVQIPGSVGCIVNGVQNFCGITTNAAKATIMGIEAEATAILARNFAGSGSRFSFNGALGYIDTKYKKFIGPTGVDVSDQRTFQNTPKWTLSGTLASTGMPMLGGALDVSTTLSYRSLTHQFEVPIPALDQPGYALWDASIVWHSDNDRYSFGVHGKNLTNKHYITSGYNYMNGTTSTLGLEGIQTAFYGNPRQVFATLGVKF